MPKPGNASPPPASKDSGPADPLEQQALAALAAGKFRKARDHFKVLCKRDRARYLPRLIEANTGLARDMLGKGMVSEAQQILAYLRTLAPPGALNALEADFARHNGDWRIASQYALSLLTDDSTTLTPAECFRLADQIVVAFEPLAAASPAHLALVADLGAIQQALQAVSEQRYAGALDLVRPLAHGSVFSHWKLFIKGLVAFHLGERSKAKRCFAELPAGSVPAKARRVYEWLMTDGAAAGSLPDEPSLGAACALMALSNPSAAVLLRVESLWREGKPQEAYELIRRAWPQFPCIRHDLAGVLSEFFFNAMFSLAPEEHEQYAWFFEDLDVENGTRGPQEQMLVLRIVCLDFGDELPGDLLDQKWREFVGLLGRICGPNARRDSQALAWLGRTLAEEFPRSFGYGRHTRQPNLRDPDRAVAALEESIFLDPDNLPAHLKLCEVNAKLNRTSARNRLLDVMTRRFPDRKEVLLEAGRQCLERKACQKGLDYLEKALALDRIDPAIPADLTRGRVMLALQQFQKHRPELARQTWALAEDLAVDTSGDLSRSRWTLLIRRGVMEQVFGEAPQGQALLDQGRATSPFPAAFLLCAHFAFRECAPRQSSPWLKQLRATGLRDARLGQGVWLVQVLRHWEKEQEDWRFWDEESLLRDYLSQALHSQFTRDEAIEMVQVIGWDGEFGLEVERCVEIMRHRDPHDPLFSLYELIQERPSPHELESFRQRVEKLQREAAQRGDELAMRLARECLEHLKHPPLHPPDQPEPEYDELESGEEAVSPFSLEDLPPDFPAKDLPGLLELLDTLSKLPEPLLKYARQSRPKNMPIEVFDLLVDIAKGREPKNRIPGFATSAPPNPPRFRPATAAAPESPKPPKPDPNQLELF